jgi:phosphatidylserine synthase 2
MASTIHSKPTPTQSSDQDKENVIKQLVQRLTVLESRSYHDDEQHYVDDTQRFFNQPRVISAIVIIIGAFLWLTWTQSDSLSIAENTRTGIAAAIFFFIIVGMLTFPTSGPFSKPLPIVWRAVFALSVIYEIFLIILLFQTKADARQLMTYLDPKTGTPLVERSYAENCSFTWENIAPNVFDRFAVAHFLGWFVKSMIIRDVKMCWIISIGWEFLEIVFTPMLPNFEECWWDSFLLDVLICNGLGILCGTLVQNQFQMMHHNWFQVYSAPIYTQKSKQLLKKYNLSHLITAPTDNDPNQANQQSQPSRWGFTRSLKRFFGVQFIILVCQMQELNAFFLKHLLWLPPESYLNPARLLLWVLFSLPCVRQFYLYMTNPHVKTLGRQAFLCIVIMATELMLIFKLSSGEFNAPYPTHLKQLIAVIAVLYITYNIVSIWMMWKNQPTIDVHRGVIENLDKKLQKAEKTKFNVFDVMDTIMFHDDDDDDDSEDEFGNKYHTHQNKHKKRSDGDDSDSFPRTPTKNSNASTDLIRFSHSPIPMKSPQAIQQLQNTNTSMVNNKDVFFSSNHDLDPIRTVQPFNQSSTRNNKIRNYSKNDTIGNNGDYDGFKESEQHRQFRLYLKQKRTDVNSPNRGHTSAQRFQLPRKPVVDDEYDSTEADNKNNQNDQNDQSDQNDRNDNDSDHNYGKQRRKAELKPKLKGTPIKKGSRRVNNSSDEEKVENAPLPKRNTRSPHRRL